MKTLPIHNSTQIALVDDEVFEQVKDWTWYLNGDGYPITGGGRGLDTVSIKLHEIVRHKNPSEEIDHINRNKLDNQKMNLRSVPRGFNTQNSTRKDTSSGLKGVFPRNGKWRAAIRFNKQLIHLGTFTEFSEAAAAYDRKALELYGPHALTNATLLQQCNQ